VGEYLTIREVAVVVKVSAATIRSYLSHRTPKWNPFPLPDFEFGGRKGWLRETVDRWMADRPGMGYRSDRAARSLPRAE